MVYAQRDHAQPHHQLWTLKDHCPILGSRISRRQIFAASSVRVLFASSKKSADTCEHAPTHVSTVSHGAIPTEFAGVACRLLSGRRDSRMAFPATVVCRGCVGCVSGVCRGPVSGCVGGCVRGQLLVVGSVENSRPEHPHFVFFACRFGNLARRLSALTACGAMPLVG